MLLLLMCHHHSPLSHSCQYCSMSFRVSATCISERGWYSNGMHSCLTCMALQCGSVANTLAVKRASPAAGPSPAPPTARTCFDSWPNLLPHHGQPLPQEMPARLLDRSPLAPTTSPVSHCPAPHWQPDRESERLHSACQQSTGGCQRHLGIEQRVLKVRHMRVKTVRLNLDHAGARTHEPAIGQVGAVRAHKHVCYLCRCHAADEVNHLGLQSQLQYVG